LAVIQAALAAAVRSEAAHAAVAAADTSEDGDSFLKLTIDNSPDSLTLEGAAKPKDN
jgi:hypothetical protein